MVERSRMELRQRGAAGMIRMAARVCLASWMVLLAISFIGAAYEGAFERYTSGLTLETENGKTTIHFSANPEKQQEAGGTGGSFLEKLFPLSFTLDDFLDPQLVENKQGNNSSQVLEEPGDDDTEDEENDGIIPTLRLVRAYGNGTGIRTAPPASEEIAPSNSFVLRRRLQEKNLVQPSDIPAGLLLGLLLVFMLAMFGMLCLMALHHAVLLGMCSYGVACTYVGKAVRTKRAIKTCFRQLVSSGMMQLLRLSLIQGVARVVTGMVVMEIFLKASKAPESLMARLSTMPFAFLAPFRDREIIEAGLAANVAGFLAVDYLLEGLAYTVYILASWTMIVEDEKQARRAFQRSWNLIMQNPVQVFGIKLAEGLVCSRSFKFMLKKAVGTPVSLLLMAILGTYFTVLWLVFYISARNQQAGSPRFDHQTLEDFLDRNR